MSAEPASAHEPLLSLQAIRVLRQQGGSSFELRVPEFRVRRGEFIAVTGESGCGKSTLLDLLALVLQPQPEGRFHFFGDGKDPIDINALWRDADENRLAVLRRRYLGYVPQSGGLLPFLTIRQNLHLPPRLNGQLRYHERIEELARRLGILNLMSRMPDSLSGGQRQRAAILRAMASQPALILADEPTAAVDGKRAKKIVGEFVKLAQAQGTAILMVTHDVRLVEQQYHRHYVFEVDSTDESHVVSVCTEEGAS